MSAESKQLIKDFVDAFSRSLKAAVGEVTQNTGAIEEEVARGQRETIELVESALLKALGEMDAFSIGALTLKTWGGGTASYDTSVLPLRDEGRFVVRRECDGKTVATFERRGPKKLLHVNKWEDSYTFDKQALLARLAPHIDKVEIVNANKPSDE